MSPIEHYFENLLTMGSDIKGEPNKNALSREVQEAVEICADYVKYDLLLDDTKTNIVAMLTDFLIDIEENTSINATNSDERNGKRLMRTEIIEMLEQKINSLKFGGGQNE